MSTSMPAAGSGWRWFVIVVQALLLASWCGLLVVQLTSDRRIHHHGLFEDICGATLMTMMFFLLFVAPWFWASLRRVALTGWLLGFAALLYVLLVAQV